MAGGLLHDVSIQSDREAARRDSDSDALRIHVRKAVHEVSNPLSIIQNYLSTLESQCAASGNSGHEFGVVKDEISRVSKILQTVLEAPGGGQPEVAAIDLNRLIEDLVSLCRSSRFGPGSVELHTDLFANPPALWTRGDQLKQLLLNLLKNAMEAVATQSPGIVRVSTAPWGSSLDPTHVEIRVEDSGPGIPAGILDHLYQPVISTKGREHLGVGLAVVGDLVRNLRGLINCRSNERGTRFQILLPLGKE